MTIVVVNQAGGADFTDLQTAIDAAPTTLTEVYEIQLVPGTYVGDLVIPSRAGESFTNCIKITHTSGNAATDFGGGAGAHILGNTGGHANTINGAFVWYQGIAVTLDTVAGDSDEAFRLNAGDFLAQQCFIRAANNQSGQDGFYFGGVTSQTATIVNCAIVGFARAGVHIQRFSPSNTYQYNLYHNTIVNCGRFPTETLNGGFSVSLTNASTAIVNAYNNIVINQDTRSTQLAMNAVDPSALDWRTSGPDASPGVVSFTGGGNVSGDPSAVGKFGAGSFGNVSGVSVEPNSGANVFFTEFDNQDFSIAGENAFTITQDGSTIPSATDPRVDLMVDMLNTNRDTIGTIGAFEFSGVAPPITRSTPLFKTNIMGHNLFKAQTL